MKDMTEEEWTTCADAANILNFAASQGSERKLRLLAAACCRRVWHVLKDERSRAAVEAAERFADGAAGQVELTIAHAAAREACDALWTAEFHVDPEGTPVSSAASAACNIALGLRLSVPVDFPGNSGLRTGPPPMWHIGMSDLEGAGSGAKDTAAAARILALGERLSTLPTFPRSSRLRPPLIWNIGMGALDGAGANARDDESAAICNLTRDILGNPFRPVVVSPSWLAWRGGTVGKLAQAAYDNRTLPSGELDTIRLRVLADSLEEAGCGDPVYLNHLRSPGPHVRGCFVVDALLARN
jgi:hypothetical protein